MILTLDNGLKFNGDYVKIETKSSYRSGACYTHLILIGYDLTELTRISDIGLELLPVSSNSANFIENYNNYLKIIGIDII